MNLGLRISDLQWILSLGVATWVRPHCSIRSLLVLSCFLSKSNLNFSPRVTQLDLSFSNVSLATGVSSTRAGLTSF